MIYSNYRLTEKVHHAGLFPTSYDFSHLTLKEIDQEIERTIELISLYRDQVGIVNSIGRLAGLLQGYSESVSNSLRNVGRISFETVLSIRPMHNGIQPEKKIGLLVRKLTILKRRRRDLVKQWGGSNE